MGKFLSKKKGNKFELEVSKLISEWFYNDKTKLIRSPTSGANLYKGDIIPNLEKNMDFFQSTRPIRDEMGIFPFVIECKNTQIVDIDTFIFDDEKGFLNKVWNKTCKEAANNKAFPIVICKKNRSKIWMIAEFNTYNYLKADIFDMDINYAINKKGNVDIIIVDFVDFIKNVGFCCLL
jgi:hypothetical protein